MLQPQRQLLCLYATNIQPTNRFLGERVISHSAVVVAKTRAIRLFRKDFDGSLFPLLWDVSHHPCVDKLAVKATEGSCHSGEQAWEKLLFFLKMSRFEYLVLFTSSEKKKILASGIAWSVVSSETPWLRNLPVRSGQPESCRANA